MNTSNSQKADSKKFDALAHSHSPNSEEAPNQQNTPNTSAPLGQTSWRAGEKLLNRVLPNHCHNMRQSGSANVLNGEQRQALSIKMADQLIRRLTQQIDAFNLRWPPNKIHQPLAASCQLQSALVDTQDSRNIAFSALIESLSCNIKRDIETFSSYNFSDGINLTLLRTILDRVKHFESSPKTPMIKGVFANCYGEIIRTALLCASTKLALPIESWEFSIKAPVSDEMRKNPWPIIENFSNFTPEAQSRIHHAMMHFYFTSKKFTQATPQQLDLNNQSEGVKAGLSSDMIALKGGYGAGKTSLITRMGDAAYHAAIGSDRIKQFLRKPFQATPQTIFHRHASTIAWELINALCDAPGQKAIFDSSLSDVKDVAHFVNKCDQQGKSLSVQDIARTDIARILAVLARPVAGEDPRIPFTNLIKSAALDQTTRPDCLNTILHHQSTMPTRAAHNYVLHASDALGTNTRELFIVAPGSIQLLVPGRTLAERLDQFGIEYVPSENETPISKWPIGQHDAEGHFRNCSTQTPTHRLSQALQKTVGQLLKTINEQESAKRSLLFLRRKLPLQHLPRKATPESLYCALVPDLQASITQESFVRACHRIEAHTTKTEKIEQQPPRCPSNKPRFQKIYDIFSEANKKGEAVSFLDLPLDFALEINAALTQTPSIWAAET